MADVLMMGSFDLKSPPAPLGALAAGDLLDALVADDLARASLPRAEGAGAGPAANAETTAGARDAGALAAAKGEDDTESRGDGNRQSQMLQREIDLLLNGESSVPPAAQETTGSVIDTAAPALESTAAAAPVMDAGAVNEIAAAAALQEAEAAKETRENAPAAIVEDLSAEELRTLIPSEPPVVARVGVPAPELDEETARQLSEAEGVLAAELAQLMADGQMKDTAAGAPAAEEEPAAPVAEVPAVAAAVAPVEEVTKLAVAEGAASAPRVGWWGRIRGFISDVLLLLAQLVDMPFSWIQDMDKNVIGFAAFLLLVSGVVMRVLAWLYG